MVVGRGRKSYLRPAEIASISSRDFSRSSKHDTFWHIVSTGYFHILFLEAIAVSDFCPLEIYKNISLPLSTITFTVNSYADNHFYKYIYLFQILYSMKSVFLLMWNTALIFSNKNHGLQKKLFIKITPRLNYMLYTLDVTYNLSKWNNGESEIYKKDQQKLKHFEKIVLIN